MVTAKVLKHDGDRRAMGDSPAPRKQSPVYKNLACAWIMQFQQQAHQCRFARSVSSHQRDSFSLPDAKRNIS